MARRTRLVAVLMAMVAVGVLPSCGEYSDSTTPGGAGPAGSAGGEKVELRLNLKEGETYKLQVTSDQKITQTMGESKQEMPQTTELGLSHLVKEVRDDGTAVVQVKFESVRFKQEGPMGKVDYDSSNPAPAESAHPMVTALVALVGQGFSVDLTSKGEAARLEGADQLVARMMENMELPTPALRPVVKQQLEQQFGNQALKEMMEQMIGVYPDEPVGVGDSWSKRRVVSRGLAAIMNNTWTLKSRSGGVAVVDVQSTVEPNPDAPPLEMGPAKLQYALRGTQNGSIELDEATGWPLRSTVNQSLAGDLTIQAGAEGAQPMTVPITVEGVTRIESR